MTEGMRRYYYSVYANYYAYLANYHQVEELDRKYKNLSDLYRDSVFMRLAQFLFEWKK
jgi:HTH-type transcriptional regulator, polysaccharide utilization system transcription regulator